MKKIFTSAFVILLTIGAAQAQTTSKAKTTEQRKEQRGQHKGGYEKLNLTADQQTRMKALRQDFKKQSAELKANTSLSAEQLKARRTELRKKHRAQVESILTTEQKAQVANSKTEWKGKKKDAKRKFKKGEGVTRGKMAEGQGQRNKAIGKELNLSAEQQAKITAIRTNYKAKLDALRADKAISGEQKRAKMQELMKQQGDQMKAVLTKEQQEKMQSLRKERPARNTKK